MFKIRETTNDWRHPRLSTSATGDREFCGYTHCRGQCGYPALFLTIDGVDYRMHGPMVAVGPVWQRAGWSGQRVFLEEAQAGPDPLRQYWR